MPGSASRNGPNTQTGGERWAAEFSQREQDVTRELTSHKVNGLNELLKIEVLDEPGAGGACHVYAITPTVGNALGIRIDFQKGPLGENPPNGTSIEALLAIIEDRLAGFQSGPFACDTNLEALHYVRKAMEALHSRTKERVDRGVEGTLQK